MLCFAQRSLLEPLILANKSAQLEGAKISRYRFHGPMANRSRSNSKRAHIWVRGPSSKPPPECLQSNIWPAAGCKTHIDMILFATTNCLLCSCWLRAPFALLELWCCGVTFKVQVTQLERIIVHNCPVRCCLPNIRCVDWVSSFGFLCWCMQVLLLYDQLKKIEGLTTVDSPAYIVPQRTSTHRCKTCPLGTDRQEQVRPTSELCIVTTNDVSNTPQISSIFRILLLSNIFIAERTRGLLGEL